MPVCSGRAYLAPTPAPGRECTPHAPKAQTPKRPCRDAGRPARVGAAGRDDVGRHAGRRHERTARGRRRRRRAAIPSPNPGSTSPLIAWPDETRRSRAQNRGEVDLWPRCRAPGGRVRSGSPILGPRPGRHRRPRGVPSVPDSPAINAGSPEGNHECPVVPVRRRGPAAIGDGSEQQAAAPAPGIEHQEHSARHRGLIEKTCDRRMAPNRERSMHELAVGDQERVVRGGGQHGDEDGDLVDLPAMPARHAHAAAYVPLHLPFERASIEQLGLDLADQDPTPGAMVGDQVDPTTPRAVDDLLLGSALVCGCLEEAARSADASRVTPVCLARRRLRRTGSGRRRRATRQGRE